MSAIQSICIENYEERSSPKSHIVYHIAVKANVRSWSVWRRYSEFDDLHTELIHLTGSEPPNPLPPKHKFSILRSHSDPKLLQERKLGLEIYLRGILGAKDPKWRESFAFKEFLGVPLGRQNDIAGGPSTQFTLASWLDEHLEIQSRLRDVRADINKREAFSDQGDITASHRSNLSAKKRLAGVLARIGTLGKSLQDLALNGMTDGELQRRTDMVARLQDDCEKLSRMVTVARSSTKNGITPPLPSTPDREQLLGGATKRITRIFGAADQETEATRPLDDVGLVGMQQMQVEQQDEQLSVLTSILRRQRQLGEAISHEIAIQNEALDSLSQDVDRVGSNLSATNKQLNRLR